MGRHFELSCRRKKKPSHMEFNARSDYNGQLKLVLLLVGLLVFLGGTAAAPFIYTLF